MGEEVADYLRGISFHSAQQQKTKFHFKLFKRVNEFLNLIHNSLLRGEGNVKILIVAGLSVTGVPAFRQPER